MRSLTDLRPTPTRIGAELGIVLDRRKIEESSRPSIAGAARYRRAEQRALESLLIVITAGPNYDLPDQRLYCRVHPAGNSWLLGHFAQACRASFSDAVSG